MQKDIAFFDFDGTITTKDSMLEFTKYTHGLIKYFFGMCLLLPWLIGMKINIVSRTKGKERFISYFFKHTSILKFNADCLFFTEKILPRFIKKNALFEINKHKKNNVQVVVVSASAENWVAPWCVQNDLLFICTKLKIEHGEITGSLLGQNCNGSEKVNRIKAVFDTADYKNIYCYGDSYGDTEMLELATHRYYRML